MSTTNFTKLCSWNCIYSSAWFSTFTTGSNSQVDSTEFRETQYRHRQNYDKRHRELQLEVGDWVFVKIHPYKQHNLFASINYKVSPRFCVLYKISAEVGEVAYHVELLEDGKIHNVFHISLLKPSNIISARHCAKCVVEQCRWNGNICSSTSSCIRISCSQESKVVLNPMGRRNCRIGCLGKLCWNYRLISKILPWGQGSCWGGDSCQKYRLVLQLVLLFWFGYFSTFV